MKTYVLYHANCHDGFGAAWAVHCYFGNDEAVEYIPVSYGDAPPPVEDGSRVIIVDFSYPRDVLESLRARVDLVVLDHHKTAMEALGGLEYAHFDMGKSGAVLAWQYFFPDSPIPPLLLYVQDRDLWKFELPMSREINAALRSYPMDISIWDTLVSRPIEALQEEGVALLRFAEQQVAMMCQQVQWKDIGGYVVPVANATCLWSEVGEELYRRYPEAPFSAYYHDLGNGVRKWGLRSRGDFDVSTVAKQFGGGGHKGAAGFVEQTPAKNERAAEIEAALRQLLAALESEEREYRNYLKTGDRHTPILNANYRRILQAIDRARRALAMEEEP